MAAGRHRRPPEPPPPLVTRVLRASALGAAAVITAVVLLPPEPDTSTVDNGAHSAVPAAPQTTTSVPTTRLVPTTRPAPTTTVTPTTTRSTPKPTLNPVPPPRVAACPSSGWGVRPHVARVGHHLAARFGLLASVIGGWRASSAVANSDHPRGLALDISVGRLIGDRIAAYAVANRDRLGITYVIWRQQINYGQGWRAMPDRGDANANHFTHVHLSFKATGGVVTC